MTHMLDRGSVARLLESTVRVLSVMSRDPDSTAVYVQTPAGDLLAVDGVEVVRDMETGVADVRLRTNLFMKAAE